jgi:hypothetical protein
MGTATPGRAGHIRQQRPRSTMYLLIATKEWELLYSECHLQAASTSISDHCSMIITCAPFHKRYKGFRFELLWLLSPEFKDIVTRSWMKLVSPTNKARILHIKLARLARALKQWHNAKMASSKRESGGHRN